MKLSPKVIKWARILIILGGLLIFQLHHWIGNNLLEQKRVEFGKAYAEQLQTLHKELKSEIVNLSGNQSYAIFDVSTSYPNAKNQAYLENLGSDMEKLFCKIISETKYDLKIQLFQVNLRAESLDGSNMILSRELSSNSCT